MPRPVINIIRILPLAVLTVAVLAMPLAAQDFDRGFPVRISYQELDGESYGEATVTLTMTLPADTPLLARETVVSNALSVLHDIWGNESVTQDIPGFPGPVIPMDVQYNVAKISGTEFIISVLDAFETVADAGFSRFQVDTLVTATETVDVPRQRSLQDYPDAPRYFAWIIGEGWPVENVSLENWVLAATVNYSAMLLSYRSEYGQFPTSIAALRESPHFTIHPVNAYTSNPIAEVDSPSPGDITFEYTDANNVALVTYIRSEARVDAVTREISVPPYSAYDLLYRQTAGLSENDKQVARYVFQISLILNYYFNEHNDLPYRVPQCEAEGFAYVSFPNPYSNHDAQQADSLANIQPGDYIYHRISDTAYYLVGYGSYGERVLSVSRDFSADIRQGMMQTE
jgi:hypothetical protein